MEQRDHHLRVIAAEGQSLKTRQIIFLMDVCQQEVQLPIQKFLQSGRELNHLQLDLTLGIRSKQIGYKRQNQTLPRQRRENPDGDALPCIAGVSADVPDGRFKIQNKAAEPLLRISAKRRQFNAAAGSGKKLPANL